MDPARVLRECAVDLIRASDLYSGQASARDSALLRVRLVMSELARVEPNLCAMTHRKSSSALSHAKRGADLKRLESRLPWDSPGTVGADQEGPATPIEREAA